MSKILPRVYSIAPGGNFLDVLAEQILNGFPLEAEAAKPPLSDWTILLPTRRAARELGLILLKKSGRQALLLPHIKPIGDLDEEDVEGDVSDLPKAITSTGQLFCLLQLLKQWADENPQTRLALEIANSPTQSLSLAKSLVKLIDQVETEEVNFSNIDAAYDGEFSDHHAAILSLLSLVHTQMPQQLLAEGLIGKSERRSRLIRLEAKRIAEAETTGPIIAAGSTGTIPATRALLKAIATRAVGAVILPGLDFRMDEQAWAATKPDHPQFHMKNLIEEMGLKRGEVQPLALGNATRNILSSELMRPTETADQWQKILPGITSEIAAALQGLQLIETRDRHQEARSIALILRHSLEQPDQTAALVTPDRDLAARVKAELLRWNIAIDDSAGEPLTRHGLAALAQCLLQALVHGLTPASLLTLCQHPDCNLGMPRDEMLQHLRNLEMAVLRSYGANAGLDGLQHAFNRASLARKNDERAHPLSEKLDDDDWLNMHRLVQRLVSILAPLAQGKSDTAQNHLENFKTCMAQIARQGDAESPEDVAFNAVIDEIGAEAFRLPPSRFADFAVLISNSLQSETVRPLRDAHPRLAIYGVLEARMMPADILILGGLNETKWPAQPDPGPWLNRQMRKDFGLQQPERDIGLAAHDFVQGLGYAQVYLTWSKRIESAPQVPSRWILRLKTVLLGAGFDNSAGQDQTIPDLAKALDEPPSLLPHAKPQPRPPLTARPVRFSVTEVEKLIRDPYGIYAKKVLKLVPLPPLARGVDAMLRGNLFHLSINDWNQRQSEQLSSTPFQLLLECGQRVFAPFMSDPEVSSFWWPRFRKMAQWLADNEPDYRQDVIKLNSEIAGVLEFELDGRQHLLHGRADRIDIFSNGKARIVDYKTGKPPTADQVRSGLSPQLPLEAAILAQGKFEHLEKVTTQSFDYIWISGSAKPGEVKHIEPENGMTALALAEKHFNSFMALLLGYRDSTVAYLPRANPVKDEDELEYDHLSRFKEWMLAGDGP